MNFWRVCSTELRRDARARRQTRALYHPRDCLCLLPLRALPSLRQRSYWIESAVDGPCDRAQASGGGSGHRSGRIAQRSCMRCDATRTPFVQEVPCRAKLRLLFPCSPPALGQNPSLGHAVQAADPSSSVKKPKGQGSHCSEPVRFDNWPGPHRRQLSRLRAPGDGILWPAGQGCPARRPSVGQTCRRGALACDAVRLARWPIVPTGQS